MDNHLKIKALEAIEAETPRTFDLSRLSDDELDQYLSILENKDGQTEEDEAKLYELADKARIM
jgi:hypothetical protein